MPFSQRSENDSNRLSTTSRNRKRYAPLRTASHGVSDPSTLEETDSDLHRAYLTQLCYAYRLSQPLDALFRLQPFSPCFMRVTPLGFRFQRFSLRDSEQCLTTLLPSFPFTTAPVKSASRRNQYSAAAPRVCAFAKSVSMNTVLPDELRPILS